MLDALTSSMETGGNEQRISLPGFISGSTRLMNGMIVPIVYPDLRGMYKWQSQHLIDATRAVPGQTGDSDEALLNFLNRVYYELRNLGVAPQDRAINFAATNAYQARQAFADAAARGAFADAGRKKFGYLTPSGWSRAPSAGRIFIAGMLNSSCSTTMMSGIQIGSTVTPSTLARLFR